MDLWDNYSVLWLSTLYYRSYGGKILTEKKVINTVSKDSQKFIFKIKNADILYFKMSYVRFKKISFSFFLLKYVYGALDLNMAQKKIRNVFAEMPQQSLNKYNLYAKKAHFESY